MVVPSGSFANAAAAKDEARAAAVALTDNGMGWSSAAGGGASFGPRGAPALLTIACSGQGLAVTRRHPATPGMTATLSFTGGGVQLRPYASAVVEKDFRGDDRTLTFAQTSAPGIVNRWRVEGADKPYGRLSVGLSAAILSGISLNANIAGTVSKDDGNETTGHVGLRAAF